MAKRKLPLLGDQHGRIIDCCNISASRITAETLSQMRDNGWIDQDEPIYATVVVSDDGTRATISADIANARTGFKTTIEHTGKKQVSRAKKEYRAKLFVTEVDKLIHWWQDTLIETVRQDTTGDNQ